MVDRVLPAHPVGERTPRVAADRAARLHPPPHPSRRPRVPVVRLPRLPWTLLLLIAALVASLVVVPAAMAVQPDGVESAPVDPELADARADAAAAAALAEQTERRADDAARKPSASAS